MRIDAAAPEPVREGVASKKGRADDEPVESFLGPLAQVLVDLAKRAMPQPQPSAAPPGADGASPGTGKAASARQLRAFALALAEIEQPSEFGASGRGFTPRQRAGGSGGAGGPPGEIDATPGKVCVPLPAATRSGGHEAPAFGRPAVPDRAAVSAEARGEALSAQSARTAPGGRALPGPLTPDLPVAEAAPEAEVSAEPDVPLPAPAAQETASTAAETALVGLYTSASAGSPLESGLQVSSHVASLHQPAAPMGAEAEGLPTIHEAAVLKTVSAGGEAARVEVQHPELGTIQLDLKLERGSMDLHAVTTSVSSAIALRASESALRTSVALAGVELRGMRVDVAEDPEKSVEVRKKRRGSKRPLDTEA